MNSLLFIFLQCLKFLRILIDKISDVVYGWWFDETEKLPPIKSPLLLDPATDLAFKIINLKVTSEQVVRAFIERIRDVNPVLNCVVDDRFGEAIAEATWIDQQLKTLSHEKRLQLQAQKPFLGVPFTTKDCFAVAGLSWTAGLKARQDCKASFDAPTVAAMKKAGAIPLAVTNVSELCMWMESSNTVYGRTSNPYHTGRTVGGSSGGEGCVISSCGSPWGVGSDVGGSIRMPSFFNGIFGHKPSTGIVDNSGQLPLAHGVINEFLVTGPMCRHAKDLLPMLKVLAEKKEGLLTLSKPVELAKVKFYFMNNDGGFPLISPVSGELRNVQDKFLKAFEKAHGIKSKKANLPLFYHSLLIWSNSMASEKSAPSFSSELAENQGQVNPWLEFIKWCFGISVHTLPALGLAMAQKFVMTDTDMHRRFVKMGERLREELNMLLGDNGVLIYPSHSTTAQYHGQPIIKTFNFAYTAIFNILGNPVTQVPLGLGPSGVPLGLQVVGGPYMDHLTIAVAREAERLFGGWIPPSEIK